MGPIDLINMYCVFPRMKANHSGCTGFTLIELLIVVVILSSLAAITVSSYPAVGSQTAQSAVLSNVKIVQSALDRYAAEHGAYPDRSLWKKRCAGIGKEYGKGSGYTFLNNRMKLFSSRTGEVCDSRRGGDYPLGPYLDKDIPVNSLIGSRAVLVYPLKPDDQNRVEFYGWIYDSDKGLFVAAP